MKENSDMNISRISDRGSNVGATKTRPPKAVMKREDGWASGFNAEDEAKRDWDKVKSMRSIFTINSVIKKQVRHTVSEKVKMAEKKQQVEAKHKEERDKHESKLRESWQVVWTVKRDDVAWKEIEWWIAKENRWK